MNPELWQEVKPALDRALQLAPADRAAYLAAHSDAVRHEVESLIRAYEQNEAFLEIPWSDMPAASTQFGPELIGSHFGPYRVLSALGQGGMGSVWLAERVDGMFTRQVALKLVHRALMGRVMTERVAREREILASLSHPNIARLFDAGFAEDGQPYLAIEYISGTPLTTYCDEHRLSVRERLEIFRQVLAAVQYAHAHLVIHRDLKPSNILVSEGGQAHLLDFGIAKLLTQGEAKETALTQFGGRPLTLDYAAPEQILGAPITTAADVYALGVMLYELLTGERPYRLKRDTRGALEEAILQVEPAAPSRVSMKEGAAQARGLTVKKLARVLNGDLDTITNKALKKSSSERYATANAFGEDIARFLRGDVVLAQRDSLTYRALKFVRRHRVAIAGVGALILTLVGGLVATTYEARIAAAQRDATLQAQLRSLTQTAAARLANADVPGASGIILEVLSQQPRQAPYTPETLNVFQEARAADAQILALSGHTDLVEAGAFSPDGRRIVTASLDHTARIWDAATGQQIQLLGPYADRLISVAFSPDGSRIATVSRDGAAQIWDLRTARQVMALRGPAAGMRSVAFSPEGGRVVTTSHDGTADVWDTTTWRVLIELRGHADRVNAAAFSPDGRRIVTASYDRTARIWNAIDGKQLVVLSGHMQPVAAAAFSPEGDRVVTASYDATARIWNAASGQEIVRLSGHTERVGSAVFSPDGRLVATASYDKTARVWDAMTGQQLMLLSGHTDQLNSVAFSPDGHHLVTTSLDKTARIWDTAPDREIMRLADHASLVSSAAFSPDGLRIVTASFDKTARIWDATSGRAVLLLSGHTDRVMSASFSPDGRRVVTASFDKTARVWDAATGAQIVLLSGHGDLVEIAAFSPDGRRVVTASDDKTARIWDAATGQEILRLSGHTDRVTCAAFAPDGLRVVTTSSDKTARIWDSTSGRQIALLGRRADKLWFGAFSPEGRRIITTSHDNTASIFDIETGRETMLLSGHTLLIATAAFSPDGRRIVTSSWDKTARLWDAATGEQLALLRGHAGVLQGANFSPDGQRIITASDDKSARIWDARIPALSTQIAWARAAQFDPLPVAARFQLGLPAASNRRRWPGNRSACDESAAAPYDPDRRAPGVMPDDIATDIALAACAKEANAGSNRGRSLYQRARALMANKDFPTAREELERAVVAGYRVARVELAMLLARPSYGSPDVARAISLCEQAWNEGVVRAAFELGSLYEHGVSADGDNARYLLAPRQDRAWFWYEKAAAVGEPNALARYAAKRLADANTGSQGTDMLDAFGYYAAAAERARSEDWPEEAWRGWRYRRASLARLLARDGMMREVADRYDEVREQYAHSAD
jgi:WD40 repeat protein/serine/threonine protein kinase